MLTELREERGMQTENDYIDSYYIPDEKVASLKIAVLSLLGLIAMGIIAFLFHVGEVLAFVIRLIHLIH